MWFEQRFEERPKRLRLDCVECLRPMWFPPSKHGKYLTCGGSCAAARYGKMTKAADLRAARTPAPKPRQWKCEHCLEEMSGGSARSRFCSWSCLSAYRIGFTLRLETERTRACAHCSGSFIVKKSQIDSGIGKYCSQKCCYASGPTSSISSPENLRVAHVARVAAIRDGRIIYRRGPEHHSWEPDREALQARKAKRALESTRRYRKNNPHKVREFTLRRKGRKLCALPRGTVALIGKLQQWRCSVCRCDIRKKFHVDHVMPLARGGQHEPMNLQLLCPTCNVRKSAKDPIRFMQERGFLL